jgi:membrane peptidoglycan carboxypeptidase
MKKKFIFVFLLAFAACAIWNTFVDTPKVNTSSAISVTESKHWWNTPMTEVNDTLYPYRHFREAMDSHIKKVPVYVSISLIPKNMQHAVIATEDRRFYDHDAIDPIGIMRAMYVNFQTGETVEGGSTLSQQVVKNVFLSQERTMTRKVQELVLAFLLERNYTKDEILEIYLNTAYFGNQASGLEKASQSYFHVKPEQLTLSQASMLAGLLQAPSYYNPLENYDGARNRQKTVLSLMAEQGYINETEAAEAYRASLHLK